MTRTQDGVAKDPLFDGEYMEEHLGDLGLCAHGITEDQDCVECRTHGCGGGGDCDCRNRASRLARAETALDALLF